MAFLPRLRLGRDRETEALRQRVKTLQASLKETSGKAQRWTKLQPRITAAIAGFMLVAGFTLGVYRDPIKQSFVGAARAVGLAKPSADAPYAAYNNGRYQSALRLARPLAEDGDARAQSLLGLMFYRGHGVSPDYKEAAKWFRLAAEQGDVDAQYHLGLMYAEGVGLPQDYTEAAKWYQLAADQGDAQAQYNLGVFSSNGHAGQQPDLVSAYMWFNLSAASFKPSDPRRQTAIGSRDLVEKQLSAEQLIEAQRRAREWAPARA